MIETQEFSDELGRELGRAAAWLGQLKTVPEVQLAQPGRRTPDIDGDLSKLYALRTRAVSNLLNVGMVGRFSSGKSFLISGLQKALEYHQVPVADTDDLADKYIGILPSTPRNTTNCPSTVVPVRDDPSMDTSGRGLLQVRFSDQPERWQDIGTNLPPAVIAAYGAADGDQVNRNLQDIGRQVDEIQLLISQAPLPAKFYDLPGAESVNPEHDAIMRRAWAEADCFIYVSQANAVLTVSELDLINDLYRHHIQPDRRKKVLWVLSGIDNAADLDDRNRPKYMATLEQNNLYLREHFLAAPGASDSNTGREVLDSFVGPGFLRVSPAWEAQAKYHADHGDEALARRRRAASRMDELRSELRCLIEAGAGRQHLVQVADEARAIVRRRLLPVSDLIATHRVPVTELASQQAGLEAALEELGKAIVDTENQLTEDVDRRIRQAQRTFDPLRKMLHQELDPVIRDGDLNDKHLNEISTCYVRCFERFMTAAGGPATTWKRHLDELVEHCEAAMRQIAGTTGTQTLVTVEPLDLSLFPFEAGRGRPVGVYALVRATAATVGLAGSITGGATWLVSAMALNPLFVVPGGIAAGAALFTMVAVRAYRDRETNLQRDRREWIERLDQQAEATRHQFAAIAREQGQLIIDTVKENLKAYQSRLEAAARQITERMGAHDIASSRDVIDRLEPLEDEGKAIVAALARSDS